MKPENWIGILQIVVTLIGMFVGPWLAVRWSLSRFRAEKWWEKRERIYSTLLQQLSFLRQQNWDALEAEEQGGNYKPNQRTKELSSAAYEEMRKYAEHGSYLISDKAAQALGKVLSTEGDYAMEHYEMMADVLKDAIDIIRQEANIEVKPHK